MERMSNERTQNNSFNTNNNNYSYNQIEENTKPLIKYQQAQSQQIQYQQIENQKLQNKQTNQKQIKTATSIFIQDKPQSHFNHSNIKQLEESCNCSQQDIEQSQSNQNFVKITEGQQFIQQKMNSQTNNNSEVIIGGESPCNSQLEVGKDFSSNNNIPSSQNNQEEDDAQICELLQQAQEQKENQQHEEAEKIYFDVLNIQKQKYGNNSYQVASTYKKIASMFQKIKNYDASLKYYNEALNIFKNQGGQTHSSREATCLISMSNIFLLKENIEDAQTFVTKALHIYNTTTLDDEQMKPLLISQALRLKRKVDLYEKQKQYEEKQISLSQEQTTCSICLEDIKKNKRVRQLNCGHIYHIKCIGQWLQLNSKCPYCRDILPRPH